MRSFTFVSLLALTVGCSDTYNSYVTNNYCQVSEDSDTDVSAGTDLPVDTDFVDTDVVDSDEPDTDVADTDAQDTGECPYTIVLSNSPLQNPYCTGVPMVNSVTDESLFQIPLNADTSLVQYAHDGQRYNVGYAAALESWWGMDACTVCPNVVAVDSSVAAAIPLSRNVFVRPGTFLVKVSAFPDLYVLDPCHTLREVSEAVAEEIYGADWSDKVRTVPDVFFADYEIDAPITSGADYDLNAALAATLDEELSCIPN